MSDRCLKTTFAIFLAAIFVIPGRTLTGAETSSGRASIVLENATARAVIDLAGGSLGDFHFKSDGELNPLHWATPKAGDTAIRGFGHFLCLDRWGTPSDAEGAKGMPYHGEAANVLWTSAESPSQQTGYWRAQMSATLPKAGLSIRRTLHFSASSAALGVREEVTNDRPLGRMFNWVQHPTIGPPFLSSETLVDCNGRRGFAQGGNLPNPEEPSFFWPQALNADGQIVNLRQLKNDPNPNVVSYTIDDNYGWVTAASPEQGLLIGYFWKQTDFPWVSLWRDVHDGQPAARGLEFGTTGLHQPFPILARKGRIWDRQLFEYLDAGETRAKSYVAFLLKIPKQFRGVETIRFQNGNLILRERSPNPAPDLTVRVAEVFPD